MVHVKKRRCLLAKIQAFHAAFTRMAAGNHHDRIRETTIAFYIDDQIAVMIRVFNAEILQRITRHTHTRYLTTAQMTMKGNRAAQIFLKRPHAVSFLRLIADTAK